MHFAILETDKILRKGYESNSSIISEDEEYIFLATIANWDIGNTCHTYKIKK